MIRYTAAKPNIATGIGARPPAEDGAPAPPRPAGRPVKRSFAPHVRRRMAGGRFKANAERLYLMLVAAADAGQPTPSNYELVAELGLSSTSETSLLFGMLEEADRIRTYVEGRRRTTEIVATGAMTALREERAS